MDTDVELSTQAYCMTGMRLKSKKDSPAGQTTEITTMRQENDSYFMESLTGLSRTQDVMAENHKLGSRGSVTA